MSQNRNRSVVLFSPTFLKVTCKGQFTRANKKPIKIFLAFCSFVFVAQMNLFVYQPLRYLIVQSLSNCKSAKKITYAYCCDWNRLNISCFRKTKKLVEVYHVSKYCRYMFFFLNQNIFTRSSLTILVFGMMVCKTNNVYIKYIKQIFSSSCSQIQAQQK